MTRRRLGPALAVAIAVTVASAPRVHAHAALEASTPAANSVLESMPASIVLDFDDGVEASVAAIELVDGEGRPIAVDAPRQGDDGTIVVAAVADGSALGDGLYAVAWKVTSDDGHVVEGAFAFQVGTAAVGDSDALLAGLDSPGDDAVDVLYAVARFLSLLGAIVLLGGGWWASRRGGALGQWRSTGAVLGAAAVMAVAGSAGALAGFAATVGEGLGGALSVSTGRALLARLVLLTVVAALPRGTRWWCGASALAVVTFPLAGHPSSLDPWPLWALVDSVHLAAVAAWFGGLAVLATLRRQHLAETSTEMVARRFSLVATVAVPLAVVTGVAQAWRQAGSLDDVSSTAWGRMLLVKVVVVVVILAVAGAARWVVQHEGVMSLRRTMMVEAVAGVAILGLVAAMVGTSPRPTDAAAPFEATLAASDVVVSVVVTPASIGTNEVHIVVSRAGGALAPIAGLEARVSLPSAGVPASPVTITREGPDHFSGTVTFAQAGPWMLDIVVAPDESTETLVTTEVLVGSG